MNRKLIEIENLTVSYDGRKNVLQNISLTLYEKEFLGITGPNGGGKTTLLKVILGLLRPVEGRVRFFAEGQETPMLSIGYLPQMNQIDKKFPISVREVVTSGLASEKPLFRSFSREQNKQIDRVMEQMELNELSARPIGELSGGQLQRTLLGRAMISRPKALILDEPGSYIDKPFETHFYQLLKEINDESAIVLVSHDIQAIESMVSRIISVNQAIINN